MSDSGASPRLDGCRHFASLKLHGFMLPLKWLVCSSVGRPEEFEEHNQAFGLLATAGISLKLHGFTLS